MKTTERFLINRKKQLEVVFSEKNLSKVWRNIVYKQMRKLDIGDMYDYYDFNYRIESRCVEISNNILSGRYRSSSPLIFKVEKKLGICRHLMLPVPSDALVFQAIVECIAGDIISTQPTKKAYYSRDKHALKLPHEVKEPGDYSGDWRKQWRKFQKDILKFSETHKYLVVTDLTNYYDSIGLRELRHVISSKVKVNEVVLDLLFNLIEQLSWNPDYLPTSLKGLPTINLEAPRLLAHALLFELDEILDVKTKGCFVRWMDDINFGVDSVETACKILGDINDVLKSRGLALNLGKTSCFNEEEVKQHFLVDINTYLDDLNCDAIDRDECKKIEENLKSEFCKHVRDKSWHNWSKVTKRFFTVASKIGSDILLDDALRLFKRNPSIRGHIAYYISSLGYTEKTSDIVIKLIDEVKIFDDVTMYQIVKILIDWDIPVDAEGCNFVSIILKKYSKPSSIFDAYCSLWIYAKYADPRQLNAFIINIKRFWKQDSFLCRQVVAATSRIRSFDPKLINHFLEEQGSIGPEDAASVVRNIFDLESINNINKKLSMYLFPKIKQKKYPFSKFLILLSILRSDVILNNDSIKKKVYEYLDDKWMLKWINKYVYTT